MGARLPNTLKRNMVHGSFRGSFHFSFQEREHIQGLSQILLVCVSYFIFFPLTVIYSGTIFEQILIYKHG